MATDRKVQRNQTLNPQQRKQMTLENHDAIEVNHKLIKQNRTIIATLGTFLVIAVIAVVYLLFNQHDMEACQAKLFTHITGMDAPTKAQLMKPRNPENSPGFDTIDNPEVYRDLFESCQ